MSVIVKGMEMPKKAMFAVIFPPDDEHGTWYISVVERKGKKVDYEIIPLPEKHGRLIDAHALVGRFEPKQAYFTEAIINKFGTAPVIVEAEGD